MSSSQTRTIPAPARVRVPWLGVLLPSAVGLLLMVGLVGYAYLRYQADQARLAGETRDAETRVLYGTLRELRVNALVRRFLAGSEREQILAHYDRYTQDRELTVLLLSASLQWEIPTHYLLGLAWAESRFHPGAINGERNRDGSADYGLLQLNSKTFAAYSAEQLMDPPTNIRLGAGYLADLRARTGDWVEALLSYNAGPGDTVRRESVRHVIAALEYSWTLDEALLLWVGARDP